MVMYESRMLIDGRLVEFFTETTTVGSRAK